MKRIGRYTVIDALGRGMMARVFLVRVPVIGRPAAAKCLMPQEPLEALMGADFLRRGFIREATLLAGLDHPHICEVFDFGHHRGVPFYLMAYHGHHLGAAIGEGDRLEAPTRTLRVERAVEYIRQTLAGLARLHEAGLVHRDIKPQNLLLAGDDRIRIADFGLAKGRGDRHRLPVQLKVGSPGYAAPEQMADPYGVDPRADLYATAVVLYRLITGRLPAGGPRRAGTACLSRLVPSLDPHWDRFMERALAPDPSRRFATAGQMDQALSDLAQRHRRALASACTQVPPPAPGLDAPPRAGRRRHLPLKVRARHARDRFALDRLWRPQRYWPGGRLRVQGQIVHDPWTDCLWQRSGSPYPLTWSEARTYVQDLNRQGFAGRNRWRLPTVDELVTLLEPPGDRDLCIEPCFDEAQRRLWSADAKSYHSAWLVSPDLGFVAWQQVLGRAWVRAVCGP